MLNNAKNGIYRIALRSAIAMLAAILTTAFLWSPTAYAEPDSDDSQSSTAASTDSPEQEKAGEEPIVTKSETVYGMLGSDGSQRETYVVNRFAASGPASVVDYGPYTVVTNLSTTQKLTCEKDRVSFDMEDKGPFFYQGDSKSLELPWKVSLAYELDGKTISPEDLAGCNGDLAITLKTSANSEVDSVFYDCFMMQITFTLDGTRCTDIKAKDATLAESGKDQTVAFTVLPGSDGSFQLSAHVTDFEMPSVQIAALPYSSVVEMPDTSEIEGDLSNLSYAISALNSGTGELALGASQLSSGLSSLASGAGEFGDGLAQLAGSSSQIVEASSQINGVLAQVAEALSGVDLSELEGLAQYAPALRDMAGALESLKAMLQLVDGSYMGMANALGNLAAVMGSSPVSDAEIDALRALAADDQAAAYALEKLLGTYSASQAAVNAYYAVGSPETIDAQLKAVSADGGLIDQAVGALRSIVNAIESGGIAQLGQLGQLASGLQELSSEYGQFHTGLVTYTQGVQTLNEKYGGISSGVSQLAEGTSKLSSGATQLSGGVSQLSSATGNLPAQMRERMGELMADYDFPAFQPVSFVDKRNKDVTAVQFVLLTDAIEKPKVEASEEEPAPEPSIWDRFLALFS